MATLRFHLPKFARRTPPSGDAGTSAPVEYPSSSAGALSSASNIQRMVDPYRAARTIVEGDGPLESGLTPSPSIDTDRLNRLLIEAAATMREQNDTLAAIRARLYEWESWVPSVPGPWKSYAEALNALHDIKNLLGIR